MKGRLPSQKGKDILFYTFDENINIGEHVFKIEVTDDKNNTSALSFQFVR